ncbi:uncharacterized protein LOC108091620 [Drosophila ficusphila]|uniref:uncharacterized protein LOC108091620 n=1 Tax=Drosophila ficusphila TaxID=30025 RepID=UPI0007E856C7|nr:uncharacterized protein LOC108091620 [Drosophila ficusphila]
MWQQVQLDYNSYWPRVEVLERFWNHLQMEIRFRTLLYYRLDSCDCWFEEVLRTDNSTSLLWDDKTYPHYQAYLQDKNLLAVACMKLYQYKEMLHALSLMLEQMRSIPVVLQLCGAEDLNTIWKIVKLSQELKMPNVLLLSWNFFTTGIFYSYELFPELRVSKLVYHAYLTLFPNKLNDLRGHPILTLPDNSEPHTIVQKGLNGSYKIDGPVWQFMIEFAKHINGSLQLAGEPVFEKTLSYTQVIDLVRNNTVDIAASVRPLRNLHGSNVLFYSYPMIVGNWCVMLPTERILSSRDALIGMVDSPWIWLFLLILYLLHRFFNRRNQYRGPLIQIIKPLVHLALLCFLQAQLLAYFIAPQMLIHMNSMQEVEEAGLKIRGMRQEYMEYPIDMRSRYESSFLLHDIFFDLAYYRNNFNISYGYTVTSVKWQFYEEAQRRFRRPLFYYSEDICVQKLSLFSLIHQRNCVHRYQLKRFIIRLHEAGLISLWYRRAYYLMVQTGRFRFGDFSKYHEAQPIRMSEWKFVMYLYGAVLLFSLAVFAMELTIYYVNVCLDNL